LVIVVLIILGDTNTHSVELLSTRDRPVTDFATYTTNTEGIHPFPHAGFKPGIPGSEWLQTHKLDSATTAVSEVNIFWKELRKINLDSLGI